MSKKILAILCICIVGILIIALIPKEVDEITNAVVNPNNGDIAFCYYDYSGTVDRIRILVFNRYGEELYSKTYLEAYTPSMVFDGNELCITLGRTYEKYSFDREGNETSNSISADDIKKNDFFGEWAYSFASGKMIYSLDNYKYCYEEPTIFRRRAKLTISNGETVVVIYQSS